MSLPVTPSPHPQPGSSPSPRVLVIGPRGHVSAHVQSVTPTSCSCRLGNLRGGAGKARWGPNRVTRDGAVEGALAATCTHPGRRTLWKGRCRGSPAASPSLPGGQVPDAPKGNGRPGAAPSSATTAAPHRGQQPPPPTFFRHPPFRSVRRSARPPFCRRTALFRAGSPPL